MIPQIFQHLYKGLTNIFQNSFYWVWAKIGYPTIILPKSNYIDNINIDQISKQGKFLLVRRSEKPQNETFDELGLVREDAISLREIPGMSMNLIVGIFRPSHISFNAKKPASNNWGRETLFLWLKYIWYVEYKNPATPIFYELKSLHKKTFPYYKPNNTDFKKLCEAIKLTPKIEGAKAKVEAESSIDHKPNKLNYWHIEFNINPIKGKDVEPLTKVKSKSLTEAQITKISDIAWQDQVAHYALLNCFLFGKREADLTNYNILHESDYCKTA